MGNLLRDFRKTIYILRKKYSFDFSLYRATEVIDFKTGVKTVNRVKYNIKKGLMLPSAIYRDYNYAALLPGAMPSQYSGIVDTNVRRIILDRRGFPKGFEININDYIIFRHMRYSIKEITEMEIVDFYSIIMKRVVGQAPFEVHEIFMDDYLDLEELVNGEEPIENVNEVNKENTLKCGFIELHRITNYPYNPFLIYENLEDMEFETGSG